jgi:hypothetical protein
MPDKIILDAEPIATAAAEIGGGPQLNGRVLDLNLAGPQIELTRSGSIDVDDIRKHLNASARSFVEWMYSGRAVISRNGAEARIGNVEGEAGTSLSIQLNGPKAGLWKDHATDEGGDLFSLFRLYVGYVDTPGNFILCVKEIAKDFFHYKIDVERPEWTTTPQMVIKEKKQKLGDKPRPEDLEILGAPSAIYHYFDAQGVIVAKVMRYELDGVDDKGKRKKTFRPYSLRVIDGKLKGVPAHPESDRPLYRLPHLAKTQTIILVEGEKCADALASIKINATSAMQGCHAPIDKTDWTALKGKTVVVWPDADKGSYEWAKNVAQHLIGLGCTVKGVTPPADAAVGWDAADCIAEGGDPQQLIDAAFDFQEPAGSPPPRSLASANDLRNKRFDPIMFVIPGYVAAGCTILAGRPKIGKSWMVLDGGLAVARGSTCLGDIQCEQGDVLYLALEDNERRLQSRITKIIGDADEWPANFYYATEWPRAEEGGLDKIRAWIAGAAKPRLVIVDVLARFRSAQRRNEQPYEADYRAIAGLQDIASATGVAIVIVHHLRKSGAESDPFEKVSGTLGLSGAADTVLVLDRDGTGVTLYGRGRDIEEIESALELNKLTGRWKILGPAAEVHRSDERSKILEFLIVEFETDKKPIRTDDIVAGTGMPRNNVDQLLFKMVRAGEVLKTGRGLYTPNPHQNPPNKKDKKVRNEEGGLDFNEAPRQRWN